MARSVTPLLVRRKEPLREYVCWKKHGDHPAVHRAFFAADRVLIERARGAVETHGLLWTIGRHFWVVSPGDHILSVPPEHNYGVKGYYAHPARINLWDYYDLEEAEYFASGGVLVPSHLRAA
jgi:hypothetical protein